MWWCAQTTYFIPAARLLCEALTFPCGTTQPPPPGEDTASGRVKVCFKTEQGVYNRLAADVALNKHGRATGCGQSCPLTARVNNEVMTRSGLDLDQHDPWLLLTYWVTTLHMHTSPISEMAYLPEITRSVEWHIIDHMVNQKDSYIVKP